jgi:hypothetical protein
MASNFSPMYFEQPIVIFDTTQSLNATTGAFVLYGGLSVNATYQSSSTSTGAFVLSGGLGVQKDVSVGGIQHIYNTTESTGVNNGALIVDGGVGIAKNLHVGGNATILGDLFVEGTYTYVNTQTINVADNTLVINAGPAGSGDGGLLIHRSGSDVTGEVAVTSGTLQEIYTTIGSLTLPATDSQGNDYYRGWWIRTSQGSAQITGYDATTKVATLSTSANTLSSPTNLEFDLYNKSYIAQYYAETQDEFRFAYVADATDTDYQLDNFDNYADVRLKTLYANTSISTNSLYTSGLSTIANLAVSNLLVASVTMDNAALKSATIGSLFVTGPSILHGEVTAGSLFVTGASLLQGDITVSGASVFNAGATTGALFVTGGSLLQGDITVSGASVFNAGATTGALFVTGGSLLQGDITVSGASVFNAGATTGALFVTGASLLQGDITVSGGSIFNNGITTGALNVTGNSILENNLTVTTGSVTISTNDYSPILNSTFATGGSILFNTVDVSPSLGDIARERIFDAVNGQASVANITSFAFSNSVVRAFDAVVSVTILTNNNTNKYAYYNLKGVQKAGNWVVNSSYVGDSTGFTFSITNGGQIQYTSTSVGNYTSSHVSFRALTTSVYTAAIF